MVAIVDADIPAPAVVVRHDVLAGAGSRNLRRCQRPIVAHVRVIVQQVLVGIAAGIRGGRCRGGCCSCRCPGLVRMVVVVDGADLLRMTVLLRIVTGTVHVRAVAGAVVLLMVVVMAVVVEVVVDAVGRRMVLQVVVVLLLLLLMVVVLLIVIRMRMLLLVMVRVVSVGIRCGGCRRRRLVIRVRTGQELRVHVVRPLREQGSG